MSVKLAKVTGGSLLRNSPWSLIVAILITGTILVRHKIQSQEMRSKAVLDN
jgi:hypothetical protein